MIVGSLGRRNGLQPSPLSSPRAPRVSPVQGATSLLAAADWLRVLRRRWTLVLAAIVLSATAAGAYSLTQSPTYAASADVLLSRQNLAASLSDIADPGANVTDYNRVAQTQASLATAPEVIRLTLRGAGLPLSSAPGFVERSSVRAKPNADILTFEVRAPDQSMARKLATAYGRGYTVYRRTVDTAATGRALEEVRSRIQELNVGDDNRTLITSLRDSEQRLSTLEALQTSNAFLVRSAQSATRVSPRPLRNVLLGLLFGLLLGVTLALLRNLLDSRVQDENDVLDELRLPLLARVPEMSRRMRESDVPAMVSQPQGPHAEAYRVLRTNLEFADLADGVKTLMITSAVQAEGKSTTAANLALAVARSGQRVILVDLDLRRPYLAKFFQLVGRPGLTDVALGRSTLDEALTEMDLTTGEPSVELKRRDASNGSNGGLRVLTSGPLPPDVGEFVGGGRLQQILADLAATADLVIIDVPPLLRVNDALTLTALVDAVVLTARLRVVRRAMLKEVQRILTRSPVRVLGCVVTGVALTETSYGYGYGYPTTNEVPRNSPDVLDGSQPLEPGPRPA